jgi:hypothetical protein
MRRLRGITADREWLIVRARDGDDTCMLAVPVRDGVPTCLAPGDVNDFSMEVVARRAHARGFGADYRRDRRPQLHPALAGRPDVSRHAGRGFTHEAEIAGLPGVRQVPALDVSFGPDGNYAYSRVSILRNLYRIPLL